MKRRYFLSQAALAFAAPAPRRILIVAGPSSHPPGTHEVSAGARLLKHCVEHMTNVPGVQADLFYDWPTDAALLAAVRSVVFIGDIFPPMRLPDPPRILQFSDFSSGASSGLDLQSHLSRRPGEL